MCYCIKYQRVAILSILGHCLETKGRKRWKTLREQGVAIKGIVDTWTKAVLKMKWKKEEAWEAMNTTKYGPSFWIHLPDFVKSSLCIEVLKELKSMLHGKQRQLLREQINKAVRLRESMVKEGKLKRYNKAVLREVESHNSLSFITLPSGEIVDNPKDIHMEITDHYNKAFSTPERHMGGIHAEGWDWATGGTKEDFISRISRHRIPKKYTDIIWEAMTSVPKAPDVQLELSEVFETPPSYHDFCNAISARPGKSAGGLTGLTYQHMKAWSKEFKYAVYQNLLEIWTSNDSPDWWKWRILCPIPKTADDTTLAGQRPIMLVEPLRKCWISLIIHRINSIWNRHQMLHPSQHGFRSHRGTDTALMGLQAMF